METAPVTQCHRGSFGDVPSEWRLRWTLLVLTECVGCVFQPDERLFLQATHQSVQPELPGPGAGAILQNQLPGRGMFLLQPHNRVAVLMGHCWFVLYQVTRK